MAVEKAKHGYVCMSINYRLWNIFGFLDKHLKHQP